MKSQKNSIDKSEWLSGPSISRQKNILRVSTETSFEIKLKQITEKLTLDGSLASKNNEGTLNQYSKNLFAI